MIGLAVTLIAVLQVAAVPVWNEAIEIDHNRQVQDEMTGVKDAVRRTAGSGNPSSASVKLGTDYPNRIVLRSPPASTGRLSTMSESNLTVENVTATGNVGTYWESTDGNLSTRAVIYTPDYNEYQGAPDTVYENSVVYNRFLDGNGTVAGQDVVNGNRINLVTVNGRLSQDSSARVSVETKPVSAPSNTVSVTNTSAGNLTVELPGGLSVEKWRRLLDDEMVENGGYVVSVEDTASGVVLEMKGGESYEMRAAKVGVGENVENTEPEYIVKRAGERTVPQGTVIEIVAEVHDGYNNPVGGATVNAEVLTGGSFESGGSTADATTGESGRASFAYEVAPGENEVRASINGDTAAYENVTFELTGFSSTGPGGGGGGAYDTRWRVGDETLDFNVNGETLNLTMYTSPNASNANVEYAVNNTTIAEVSPKFGTTNIDGENTTTLNASRNGIVKVYTSSGGSGDTKNVTVENFPAIPLVYNNDATAVDVDGGGKKAGVRFSITNQGGSDLEITDAVIDVSGGGGGGGGGSARQIFESGQTSPWNHEVTVGSGYADEGTEYSLGDRIVGDGYEDDMTDTFQHTIASGNTEDVYLYQFQNNGGNPVDMVGKTVTVTFYFQNEDPVTFNATP